MRKFPSDVNFALHEIGSKGRFTREGARKAAEDFCGALALMPEADHMLVVGGYDDDPRELWTVPEVKEFVRDFTAWVAMTSRKPLTQWRLDQGSIMLIALCSGIGRIIERDPVTGNLTVEVGARGA